MKTKWTYAELTEQAERTITEHMDIAQKDGGERGIQCAAWAFGMYVLWFDLVCGSEEFELSDSMRLRAFLQANEPQGGQAHAK